MGKPLSVARVWAIPFLGIVLAAVFFLCVWLHYSPWYPPVGTFIAILAFVGVLMPLFRDVAKIGKREKAFWTAIMFALVLLEIRSLYRDRSDLQTKEQQAREQQLKGFQKVGDGIEAAIKQSQEHFDATMAGIVGTINTETGGESYAYLSYVPRQSFLAFIEEGKFPLYGVNARIVNLDIKPIDLGTAILVGDMIKGHATLRPVPPNLAYLTDHFNANIFFTARNGDWDELLRVQRTIDGWAMAIKVLGRFVSLKKEKAMCETIDKKFKLDSSGAVEKGWIPDPKLPHCK